MFIIQAMKLVIFSVITIILAKTTNMPDSLLLLLAAGFFVYGLISIATKKYHRFPLYAATALCILIIFLGYNNNYVLALMLFSLMIDVFSS